MNIQSIDKSKKEVTVVLDSDELVKICNCLYKADSDNQKGIYHQLYSEMIVARELSQYGHIDNWALSKVVEQRVHCGLKLAKENEYDRE